MTGKARLTIIPPARRDYREDYNYYSRKNVRAARNFEKAIEKALALIQASPTTWPFYDETYRFYVVKRYPYVIYYRIEEGDVYVVAIAHGSRREDYWRDRI